MPLPRSPLRKQTGDELDLVGAGPADPAPADPSPAGPVSVASARASASPAASPAVGYHPVVNFRAARGQEIRQAMRVLAATTGRPVGELYERALLEFIDREERRPGRH